MKPIFAAKKHAFAFLLFCLPFLLAAAGCQPAGKSAETFTPPPTASATLPLNYTATNTVTEMEATPTAEMPGAEMLPSFTSAANEVLASTPIIVATDQPLESSVPAITNTPMESQTPTLFLSPTRTFIPTRTPYPTLTRRPSRTPSITPTSTPQLAYYRINNLGMYSKVISPVRPEAIVSPGEDGLIHVEMIGDDGQTLKKEVFDYSRYVGQHFGIAPEIDFSLNSVSESARLIISSYDRFERLMWLSSVDLVLLSIGKNQITAPSDFTEPYIIQFPKENDEIQGGMLQVSGRARILNANPLIFECVDSNGNILSSAQVELNPSIEGMSHIPFAVYLPYQVSEATNVRFSVRQESNNRIPGTISFFSYEITLLP
jgi:hypothetical protein